MENRNMKQKREKKIKKTKEEKKRERELNNSIKQTNAKTRKELGIWGYQTDDRVYFMGNNKYMKVYKILEIPTQKDKEEKMITVLAECADGRIRITGLSGHPSSFFLTVNFEGNKYVEIHDKVKRFEKMLEKETEEISEFRIEGCEIDQVLLNIADNFGKADLQFDLNDAAKKKESWKEVFFSKINSAEKGIFTLESNNAEGSCLLAEEYPAKIKEKIQLDNQKNKIFYALDFQAMNEADTELLNFMIRQKYNVSEKMLSEQKSINFTYMVCILSDTEEKRKTICRSSIDLFKKQGVLLNLAENHEREICESILSFGLKDFKAMRNVNVEIVGQFLS